MQYNLFLTTVKETLQEALGDTCQAVLRRIPKNNGVVLDGLSLERPGCPVAPTIYLNSYYEEYEQGLDFDDIIQEILCLFRDHTQLPSSLQKLVRLSLAREQIAYKLINTGANRELLEDLPHVPFHDLSLVFYLCLNSGGDEQITAMIHRNHQAAWKISTRELYGIARENTPRLLPPRIQNLEDVLREITRQNLGDDYREEYIEEIPSKEGVPLYVLSNTAGINGACCMLYDSVLKNFAEVQGKDFVILPSSIHEVILIPKTEELCFSELYEMVSTINENEVPVQDRLSNQIYLYTRKSNQISLLPKLFEEA